MLPTVGAANLRPTTFAPFKVFTGLDQDLLAPSPIIIEPVPVLTVTGFSLLQRYSAGEDMATTPKVFTNAAGAKLRRAQEASKAMKEYEATRLAVRAKTERLRAERLEREAANPTTKKPR